MDTKKIAQQKVGKALELIERAQGMLRLACEELSPIVCADEQWEMIGNHYDATKALWHRVNQSVQRDKVDLDSDAKANLERSGR